MAFSTACTKETPSPFQDSPEPNDPAVLDEYLEKVQHLFKTSKWKQFDQKDVGKRVWNCDQAVCCTVVAEGSAYDKDFPLS